MTIEIIVTRETFKGDFSVVAPPRKNVTHHM